MALERRARGRATLRSRARAGGLLAAGLAVGALLAGAPHAADASRLFVPRQHRTLQKAIDASSPGDTIWVAPGVYRGPFVITRPVVLFGEGGAEKTILDGADSVRVLRVEGVKVAAVIGFTIRGGKSNSGGGVAVVRDTSFTISDCVLTKNWESAVSIWSSQGVVITSCTMRENKGSAVASNASTMTILNSQFFDNEGHEGGAVSLSGTRIIVPFRNLTFERNHAEGSTGGALCAEDSTEGTIVSCAFRDNTSSVAGGALASMSHSTLNVSRSIFERNHAAGGGAIQCDHARVNVGYCLFQQNSALAFGAVIGIAGRGTANVNPTLANNTYYKNEVKGDGANLFFTDVSPNVRKSIFIVDHGQRAVSGLQSTPIYDCNLIWDPSGGAIGALPSANTWVGDPLFCDAEHGNFKLRDLSPALRAPCGPIGAFTEKAGCSTFRLQPAN